MSNESCSRRSFLGLEKCHVFISGASGAIGGEAVREFLGLSALFFCLLDVKIPIVECSKSLMRFIFFVL